MNDSRAVPVCCIGELMWDLHTELGASFGATPHLRPVVGGAAANVATQLVAAGVPTAVSGFVSADALGERLRAALREAGVDTSAVSKVEGRTGLVFVERLSAEHERIVSYRPRYQQLPRRFTTPSCWTGMLFYLAAVNPDLAELEATLSTVRSARNAGAIIMIDLNARPRAWRNCEELPEALSALLLLAQVVKASEDDLKILPLASEPASLHQGLMGYLAPDAHLVLTQGAKATRLYGPHGDMMIETPKLQAVRSIGAGDAFCAGFIRFCVQNEGLPGSSSAWREALKTAQAQAAAWITRDW